VDIADVVGREVELPQVQWRVHLILNVNDISVIDNETVNLEWVSSLERVLPTFLPQRNAALLFRYQLGLGVTI
jgi:hypothetical protein